MIGSQIQNNQWGVGAGAHRWRPISWERMNLFPLQIFWLVAARETNFVNIGSVPSRVPVDKLTSCQQMIQLQRERRLKHGRCCMELHTISSAAPALWCESYAAAFPIRRFQSSCSPVKLFIQQLNSPECWAASNPQCPPKFRVNVYSDVCASWKRTKDKDVFMHSLSSLPNSACEWFWVDLTPDGDCICTDRENLSAVQGRFRWGKGHLSLNFWTAKRTGQRSEATRAELRE